MVGNWIVLQRDEFEKERGKNKSSINGDKSRDKPSVERQGRMAKTSGTTEGSSWEFLQSADKGTACPSPCHHASLSLYGSGQGTPWKKRNEICLENTQSET